MKTEVSSNKTSRVIFKKNTITCTETHTTIPWNFELFLQPGRKMAI